MQLIGKGLTQKNFKSMIVNVIRREIYYAQNVMENLNPVTFKGRYNARKLRR